MWDGCDLFWQLEDDRFVGRLKPGACRFDSDAFGQKIILEETLTFMEDKIWFADGIEPVRQLSVRDAGRHTEHLAQGPAFHLRESPALGLASQPGR